MGDRPPAGASGGPLPVEVRCRDAASDRLDVFLARSVEDTSRTALSRAIRQGHVSVNGKVELRPSARVGYGDSVRWRRVPPPPSIISPEPLPLSISYEDNRVIVVDKPAGMPVHPGAGHRSGTLVNALLHHVGAGPVDAAAPDSCKGLSGAHAATGPVRPGIVHRLDKDTTGLLVIARDDAAHRVLASQFEARSVLRRYVAIVHGSPVPISGIIDAPIGRDPRDRKRMAVTERGKRAVTQYEITEAFDGASLVRFRLHTGRTHQIRVHARYMGHPLVGDATYALGKFRTHRMHGEISRQALHAELLGFAHPQSGREMEFSSDMPEDMQRVLRRLRKQR